MGHHMPMFHAHAALALESIALVSAVLLLNKAKTEGFFCKTTGKVIGGLVTVLMILSMLCTGYLTVKRITSDDMPAHGWQHPPIDAPQE